MSAQAPWVIDMESNRILATDARQTIICTFANLKNPAIMADACLISAAPELLEAVRALLYKYAGNGATPDGDTRAFDAAHAAIAKAFGSAA